MALEIIAAARRTFDRETVSFGSEREYVVIWAESLVGAFTRDVGCEPSFDEKTDLSITCENHVMLRGVDQVVSAVSR
jgi:hypothetical protein